MYIFIVFDQHQAVLAHRSPLFCCQGGTCREPQLGFVRLVFGKDAKDVVQLHEQVPQPEHIWVAVGCQAEEHEKDRRVIIQAFHVDRVHASKTAPRVATCIPVPRSSLWGLAGYIGQCIHSIRHIEVDSFRHDATRSYWSSAFSHWLKGCCSRCHLATRHCRHTKLKHPLKPTNFEQQWLKP